MHYRDISNDEITRILDKLYQYRNLYQHSVLTAIIKDAIPNCSQQKSKLLSFFAVPMSSISSEQLLEFTRLTVFITRKEQSGSFEYRQIMNTTQLRQIWTEICGLSINGKKLMNCESISSSSIEEEIKFLQNCKYFVDIPRMRFYNVLRNIEILQYSFGQRVYQQDDIIDEESTTSGIFVVRQGQFCFAKKQILTNKLIELISFGKGHIFGLEEDQQEYSQFEEQPKIKRKFTVCCKSGNGIVYKLNESYFNLYLKKSCDLLLRRHKDKLNKYLTDKQSKIEKYRSQNIQFLSQPIRHSFSTQLVSLSAKNLSTSRLAVSKKRDEKPRRNTQLPLINLKIKNIFQSKLLTKVQIANNNPEYQQQRTILQKKLKCEKIRELSKYSLTNLTRGEVLFGLMKTSWKFQKERRKISKI